MTDTKNPKITLRVAEQITSRLPQG